MLPTQVFQLDYQDFGNLVWNHLDKIEQHIMPAHFDLVIGKLRNGVIPGSIIASYLGIPLGVVNAPRQIEPLEYKFFIPEEFKNKVVNILFVDAVCGTGESLDNIMSYLKQQLPQANIVSYITLVDKNARIKPDIVGEIQNKYIQPPWEWVSFTPQSHLERLEAGYTKATQEKDIFIGFSSNICKDTVENVSGKFIEYEWVKIFKNFANDSTLFQASSGVSSFNRDKEIPLHEYRTKYKNIIDEKVNFILSNGITHYIEENQEEALLISQECPVSHIFYFDGYEINKIYSKKSSFDILRFT